MREKTIWLLVAAAMVVLCAPAGRCLGEKPAARWTWKAPVVVDEIAPQVHADRPWRQRPQFFWTKKGLVLAQQGLSRESPWALWRRTGGKWHRLGAPKGPAGRVNQMLVVGDDLARVTENLGRKTFVYSFQRIAGDKMLPPVRICQGSHIRFAGAVTNGSTVWVFFFKYDDNFSKREVHLLCSTDGGKTWPGKPIVVTTELSGLGSPVAYAFSPKHLIVLTAAAKAGMKLHRSTDGGKTWRAKPLELDEGIKNVSPRLPLQCFARGKAVGMVYIAGAPPPFRLMFTYSLDLGRTWQKPVYLGGGKATTASQAQTAAAGQNIFTSGVAMHVTGAKGGPTHKGFSWPFTISADGGRTWHRLWHTEVFEGIQGYVACMGVAGSPSGDRILLGVVMVTGPKNARQRKLIVRELSPPRPGEKVPERVACPPRCHEEMKR